MTFISETVWHKAHGVVHGDLLLGSDHCDLMARKIGREVDGKREGELRQRWIWDKEKQC